MIRRDYSHSSDEMRIRDFLSLFFWLRGISEQEEETHTKEPKKKKKKKKTRGQRNLNRYMQIGSSSSSSSSFFCGWGTKGRKEGTFVCVHCAMMMMAVMVAAIHGRIGRKMTTMMSQEETKKKGKKLGYDNQRLR